MSNNTLDDVLIEYLGYWEGEVLAGRLAALKDVNRQHAQTHMIGRYEGNPASFGKIVREGRRKVFMRESGAPVSPAFIGASPADLLKLHAAIDVMTQPHREAWKKDWKSPAGPGVPLEPMPSLETLHASHEAFRALHSACARGVAITLRYRSRTTDQILMRVSPHALVSGADRLHFRCFVEEDFTDDVVFGGRSLSRKAGHYWSDIVPYRVLEIQDEDAKAYVDGAGDAAWHGVKTVGFRLNETLDAGIIDAVFAEYDGATGFRPPFLILDGVREALVPYVIRKMRWRVFDDAGPVELWRPLSSDETRDVKMRMQRISP